MNDTVATAAPALQHPVTKKASGTWKQISQRANAEALYRLSHLTSMLRTPGVVLKT